MKFHVQAVEIKCNDHGHLMDVGFFDCRFEDGRAVALHFDRAYGFRFASEQVSLLGKIVGMDDVDIQKEKEAVYEMFQLAYQRNLARMHRMKFEDLTNPQRMVD